jgi:hypothetical protein
MDKKDTIDKMDKLVRRVTVVQGSGEHRRTDVVYENDEQDDDDKLDFTPLERGVRRIRKAAKGSRSANFPIPRFDAFGIPRFGPHGTLWPTFEKDDDDGD